MKKLLVVVAVLVVLLVGAVVAAPFLIPSETIKAQLTTQVENATGRKLSVGGDIDLAVLPNLAVDLRDVSFANVPDSDVADMVTLKELKVGLKLLPLLRGAVEISQFVLVEPVIHLEVDADGKGNWVFDNAGGSAGQDDSTGDAGASDSLPITELKLGDIRLENGRLTFVDHATGAEESIDAINMQISLADIQSPLEALGSLGYKGQTVKLELGLDNPYAVLQGQSSPLRLGVNADPVTLGLKGDLKNQGAPSMAGTIELSVPSIKQLIAWLAEPIDVQGEGLEALTIAGQLNGSAQRIAFTDATISLDQIEGLGEFTADLSGTVPKIGGRLDLGMVDLNPYLPPVADGEAVTGDDGETATTTEGDEAVATADWSDEPIELPALGGVDLAFELTVDSLKMRDLKLDRTVLALSMTGPTLTAELKEFGLYEGQGNGRLEVSVADGQARIENHFSLSGLRALPFLTDAAGFERIDGTANAEFSLTTSGLTERELVQNLNGEGKVVFADGAISGINIAAMVRNASTAFLNADAGEARKTDFAELSGSFVVNNGILTNDDLTLQAPTLRVSGRGTVDLPARQVDYRLEPTAAATLEGQGGAQDVAGVLVPIIVKGPFDDLSFAPDLSNLVGQAIEDPKLLKKQVKQQLDALGDAPKDIKNELKNLKKDGAKTILDDLSGGGDESEGSPAGSLLKGLLKK